MTLQSSGLITLNDVNIELQRSSGSPISLNDSDIRLLTQTTSGTTISLTSLYGKTYVYTATIASNVQEINLETWAKFYGWNGVFPAVITINPGVYVWSDNTAVPALATGNFPRGVTIINYGFIMGKGGAGGTALVSGSSVINVAAGAGGPAISLGAHAVVNMAGTTSYIGGGGGGGSGMIATGGEINGGGGGGAGGGPGGQTIQGRALVNGGTVYMGSPGAGGAIGAEGGYGTSVNSGWASPGGAGGGGGSYTQDGTSSIRDSGSSGAGGGRIFPGTGGAGGDGGLDGGAGGAANAAGAAGASGAGGGGGWGASGGNGGAGGKAVALNGYTCTLQGATTRIYGAVS